MVLIPQPLSATCERLLAPHEFASIKNFKEEKRQLEATARRTLQKEKRINIRISARDLEKLQKRAAAEGMPYQTLIASTLHKCVTGQLKEVK